MSDTKTSNVAERSADLKAPAAASRDTNLAVANDHLQPPPSARSSDSTSIYDVDSDRNQEERRSSSDSDVDEDARQDPEEDEDEDSSDPRAVFWKSYKTTLDAFAKDTAEAANRILKEPRQFTTVIAVVAYWQKPKDEHLKHIKENADKLASLLDIDYDYKVVPYEIPRDVADWEFTAKVGSAIKPIMKDTNGLCIFYYGGHATVTKEGKKLFMAETRPSSPFIEWNAALRQIFRQSQCGKLFLLDCCHAGDMMDEDINWDSPCELLGACSGLEKASAWRDCAFTVALYKELGSGIFDIWELHATLLTTDKREKEYKFQVVPWYRDHAKRMAPSIALRKANALALTNGKTGSEDDSKDATLQRLKTKYDARIVIKVYFKGSAEKFLEDLIMIKKDWERWFRNAPHCMNKVAIQAIQQLRLESIWDSNSCMAIWSMPVWLFDAMPPTAHYQYLGLIRSENFTITHNHHPLPFITTVPTLPPSEVPEELDWRPKDESGPRPPAVSHKAIAARPEEPRIDAGSAIFTPKPIERQKSGGSLLKGIFGRKRTDSPKHSKHDEPKLLGSTKKKGREASVLGLEGTEMDEVLHMDDLLRRELPMFSTQPADLLDVVDPSMRKDALSIQGGISSNKRLAMTLLDMWSMGSSAATSQSLPQDLLIARS